MSGYCFDRAPRVSAEFIGMTVETMQAKLVEAQTTYGQLMNSKNINSASYAQGAGSKSVTNQAVDADALYQYILRLTTALGLSPRRRAMSPGF